MNTLVSSDSHRVWLPNNPNQPLDLNNPVYKWDEIENQLNEWSTTIEDWAERIQWAYLNDKIFAFAAAKFLRKLVAECWIHLLADKAKIQDLNETSQDLPSGMSEAFIRAQRCFKQLVQYWPGLAKNIERRLPKTVPESAPEPGPKKLRLKRFKPNVL